MAFHHRIEDIQQEAFSHFVKNHPEGNIFQTPEMYTFYSLTKNYEPVLVVKTNEDNEIVASFLTCLFSEKDGFYGRITRRAMTLACPLLTKNTTYTEVLKQTHQAIGNRALYLKISNIFDKSAILPELQKVGYEFEPHLNFLINLNLTEDTLWKNLHETRRKQIKRGYNRGLTIKVTDLIETVDEHYAILEHTYSRAGLPVDDISVLENANKVFAPKGYLKCVSAYFENKLVAHRLVLTYKDYIYDWYAGNLTDYNHLYPNDVLVWETLKWGMQNGYRIFNFGGAGHPDKPYGVREFKRKFGGEMVAFGYFSKILKPYTYRLLKQLQQLIKNN